MGFPIKFVINSYTTIFHWISFIKSFFILKSILFLFGLNKTISVFETFKYILLAFSHFARFFRSILMNLLRWFSWPIESLRNNLTDVNPKFFNSSDFPIKLFFQKNSAISFFLLENLMITQSLCLILWHASRSPAETGVPVRDKDWHIDSSSCMSWISSGTGFIFIISLLRYCRV